MTDGGEEEANSSVEVRHVFLLSETYKVKAVSLQMTDNVLNVDRSYGNLP